MYIGRVGCNPVGETEWPEGTHLILLVRQIDPTYTQTRFQRTALDQPFLFVITGVRYNRVNLCAKITNLPLKSVRYNRVFVNNRVRYNRVRYNRVRYNRVSLYSDYDF